MVSEVQRERLRRLKEKHADGLLLWELKNGYELSPRESELVLETAKGILSGGGFWSEASNEWWASFWERVRERRWRRWRRRKWW